MKITHTEDYQKMRAREYPKAEVLADALYWQAKGDRTKMDAYLAACEVVKKRYPSYIDIGVPATIDATILEVDQQCDAARLLIVGDPIRLKEYETAGDEAQDFKDAKYLGPVPRSVKSWAEAKNWTAIQAADDILVAAGKWNEVMYALRDLRLKVKERIKVQTTEPAIASQFTSFQVQLNTILSAL